MMSERASTAEGSVAQLLALLDLEPTGTDSYRGARQPGGVGRVFGGQVVAQALVAAQRSIDGAQVAHSLHAAFMRPGSEDHPIDYRVFRDFDGRSFAGRRVVAEQGGKPILNLIASFQTPEDGFSHHTPMPDVPMPEDLADERAMLSVADGLPQRLRDFLMRPRPVEFRPVNPERWLSTDPREPTQHSWFRIAAPLPDDPALHRAAIAYASDMMLLGTSLLPHGVSWMGPGMRTASLDHALWLHEDARADNWLLYTMDSPWAGGGRGLNRGRIYACDGRLIASCTQEGLIRRV